MADHRGNNNEPQRPPRPSGPPPRMSRGIFGWVVFIMVSLLLVMTLMQGYEQREPLRYDQFLAEVEGGNVESVTIKDNVLVGQFEEVRGEGQHKGFEVQLRPNRASDDALVALLRRHNVKLEFESGDGLLVKLLLTLVPWLLLVVFIWFIVFRQLRGIGGGPGGMLGNFGRSRHKVTSKEHTNVTFNDVAGVDEAKEDVTELIEFLKNPKRFQKLGGRIPRGVLLVGEPGCGKTLLAKAIAGEADVPFFSISGSDFVEMFVGVGASRVRDLFKQAKENAPCIIFLDEIDAVGRRRSAGFTTGGHDEREQTLNAILVEMDGFDTSDQVIVIAATNRADVLDPALVRPGRFDRQVFVPLPDVQGRLAILRVHARKIKLGPNVDLSRLARGTPMFSGADLEAIINEAALLATLANKDYVEMADLEEARDKVRWGRAKKTRNIDEKERMMTAYHEAGHSLVQCMLPDADPLHKVSIIPRGPYGGASFSLPEKDRTTYNRHYLEARIRIACAGRVAEELICGDVNSGATSDIRQATELARRMVTEWGMSERVGFIYYGEDSEHRNRWLEMAGGREYSQQTAQIIDEEVRKLIEAAYDDARRIIEQNREKLEALAQALLKYETLDAAEVHALIRGESLDRPTVHELLDADHVGTARPVAKPARTKSPPEPELGSGPLPQPG